MPPRRAIFQDGERIVIRTVVEAEHDDGADVGPERTRIAAPLGIRGHPLHVAVRAAVEKLPQPLGRKRDGVRPRDAHDLKALRAGLSGERRLERRRGQKSRLA